MPGPAPKHPSTLARPKNQRQGFRSLPAEGRTDPAPPWPLGKDLEVMAELAVARQASESLAIELDTAEDGRSRGRIRRALDKAQREAVRLEMLLDHAGEAELALWVELWATPQAIIWEESFAHREVAQYVRWKIRGEQGDLKASVEARQLSDRLGLNPLALMRLRTEIEHADEAADKGDQRRQSQTPPKKAPAKKRSTRANLHAV